MQPPLYTFAMVLLVHKPMVTEGCVALHTRGVTVCRIKHPCGEVREYHEKAGARQRDYRQEGDPALCGYTGGTGGTCQVPSTQLGNTHAHEIDSTPGGVGM